MLSRKSAQIDYRTNLKETNKRLFLYLTVDYLALDTNLFTLIMSNRE